MSRSGFFEEEIISINKKYGRSYWKEFLQSLEFTERCHQKFHEAEVLISKNIGDNKVHNQILKIILIFRS